MLKVCGILILMMALMFTGCTAEDITSNDTPSITFGKADYFMYSDINSLVDASNVIVVGEVISARGVERINVSIDETRYERPLYFNFMVSELKVQEVVKGEVNPGDIMRVMQMGGAYSGSIVLTARYEYLKKGQSGVFFLFFNPEWDMPASLINPEQGFVEIVAGEVISNDLFGLFAEGMSEEMLVDVLVKEEISLRY